jgi:tripartite-type tricarboxylate transporter receptor subunit TctC
MPRHLLQGVMLLAALAATLAVEPLQVAAQVTAQTWPSAPIRIVVPFPPGGTTDQIARRVQPQLQADLGVPVIVENKSGASGAIGTQAVVVAPADGTTFLLVFDTHAVNPSLLPNLPFDTLKDLAPIMLIGTSPMILTAHPSTPYTAFADVLAAAGRNPGAVFYGTIGAGSLAHLAMTQIANELKVTLTHVPYKGGGPLLTDAIGGHVPLAIASMALLSSQVQAGALRPLAVTSSERYPLFPATPTVAELGAAAFDAEAWWGLLAPARTPAAIIVRMRTALRDALLNGAVKQSLAEQGVQYRLSSPVEFGSFLEREVTRWAKVVKENKLDAEVRP